MGIKRTAAGRIYFDADDAYGDERDSAPDRAESGDRQNQVLGLLGQLGDRLQRSESDREELLREVQEYRRTVTDLEEKAARAEKIVAAMQGRVSKFEKTEAEIAKRQDALETDLPGRQKKLESEIALRQEKLESDLARRQESLEKAAQEQNQKIARTVQGHSDLERRLKGTETIAGALEGRITESVEQQARLNRRLEKISQDKVRLLRKIERMEEVVAETQETLRARAMVLLTDQTLAAGGGSGARLALPAPESAANDMGGFFDRDVAGAPWWRRSIRLRGAALAGIVAVSLLGGWIVSAALRPGAPAVDDSAYAHEEADLAAAAALTPEESAPDQEVAVATEEASLAPRSIDSEAAPLSALDVPPVAAANSEEPAKVTDSARDEALLSAYAKDPDAVAAQMNALEPGGAELAERPGAKPVAPLASVAPVPVKQTQTPDPEPVQVASLAPPQAAIEARTAPPSAAGGHRVTEVKQDRALPAKFKTIETKALAGDGEAQHDLAAIYTAGHEGVAQDYAKAAFWFRKSAEGGVANAAYNLGVLHHQGFGMRKDMGEAIRWYKTASEKGHPEAQYNLGIAFIEGIGVPYDPKSAARYFEAAASAGVVEAAYNLGMIYENGLLGEAQPDLALVWYKTAADKGNPEARLALEQLAKSLRLDPADIDRVVAGTQHKDLASPASGETAPRPLRADERTEAAPSGRPLRGAAVLPGMDLPVDDVLAHPDTGTSSIDQVVVSQIQRQLRSLGLYSGAADGVMGEKTGNAIRSYQGSQGLPVDGMPSEDLLVHMLAHDLEGLSTDAAMESP